MRHVQARQAAYGLPSVAVAQAWLDRADPAAVLEAHATLPFVRRVWHKPRAHSRPGRAEPGGMAEAAWPIGFARLATLGLHFELQTPRWRLHEAARLAADFEATTIALNHTGLPADRSTEGIVAWRRAMTELAPRPNVSVKISGIGVPGRSWSVHANREIVETTIELFGPRRCMFASNFQMVNLHPKATADGVFSLW